NGCTMAATADIGVQKIAALITSMTDGTNHSSGTNALRSSSIGRLRLALTTLVSATGRGATSTTGLGGVGAGVDAGASATGAASGVASAAGAAPTSISSVDSSSSLAFFKARSLRRLSLARSDLVNRCHLVWLRCSSQSQLGHWMCTVRLRAMRGINRLASLM